MVKKVITWIDDNSLFLIALALSAFATGIEGEYMGGWMPAWLFWSGYVLNLLGDIASLTLSRWYGRLVQANRAHADKVLWGEFVAIAYSLFFSWRQLRSRVYLQEVSPMMEQFNAAPWMVTAEIELVALVSASFVPVVNAFLGFAQSLRDGRASARKAAQPEQEVPKPAPKPEQPDPKPVPEVPKAEPQSSQPEPKPAPQVPQLPAATIESWRDIYQKHGSNGTGFVTVTKELAKGEATLAQAEEKVLREWLEAAGPSAQVSETSLRTWRKEAREWCEAQQAAPLT